MYGLSELYQLRGRVGRSDAQAFAYFVSPPAGQTHAYRNQKASGYRRIYRPRFLVSTSQCVIWKFAASAIWLGQQQSGFVNQMGFEMFIDIIEEAVSELKEFEFKELFKEDKSLEKLNRKITKREEQIPAIIENDLKRPYS
ncbi:MAG: hypothetical protein AB2L26_11295 [Ignavibacteria bacterium]